MPNSQNRVTGRRWLDLLMVIFQGMVAVGTITLAALAIWGIFFTNLPEAVVRQLRTDVADAKEQLADLRQQRRRLVGEIETTKQQLVHAEERRQRALNEIQALEAERANLQSDIGQLDSERREYFQRILEIYVSAFRAAINADLKKLHARVVMVRDFENVSKWAEDRSKARPNLRKPLSSQDRKRWNAWYEEWWQKVPEAWVDQLLIGGIGGNMTEEEIIREFMIDVASTPKYSLATGYRIIARHARGEQLSLFLESDRRLLLSDRRLLLKEIDLFVDAYSDVMARPLDVSLPEGWSVDMIPAIVSPVLETHRRIEKLLKELESRLASLARSTH